VQPITALGVTLSYNFTMAKHIDTVMSSCARTLYGLRTLRGMVCLKPPCSCFSDQQPSPNCFMLSLPGGALQMQGTGIVWKASSAELRKQATITTTPFPLLLHTVIRLTNSYFLHYNTVTSTLHADFLHLNAIRHMTPDPVPITIISHKNSPASMNVIICFVCYTNTVTS